MSLQTLNLAVTFLTGRYHGEEWPPSPARLYQALVAGVNTCGYGRLASTVEPALRWLERQSSPRIRACAVESANRYRIAVPNNDMDVVAWEWVCGRSADPAALRTMKGVQAREVHTEGPHVQYIWLVEDGEAAPMVESLRNAAHCLHTLGWGIDMAFADICEPADSAAVYEPAATGNPLDVPMDGTLDDLHATYERFKSRTTGKGVDTYTRPSLLRRQLYRETGDVIRPDARFMLAEPKSDEVKPVAWEHCMKVAGWLRHAAAEALGREYPPEFIQEYVEGHTKEEKGQRLSYVPLPSIYSGYGDGLIRRVLILEPPASQGHIVRRLQLKLAGRILSDKDGRDVCSLTPAKHDDWTFNLYMPPNAARVWRTVTPVVLHGFNGDRHGGISIAKTERLLLRALEMAGYPEKFIERLAFQTAPLWKGPKHASAMLLPDHLRGYPRIHVEVRFNRGMRGPVLAGIGRHYGIGLFAAAGEGKA